MIEIQKLKKSFEEKQLFNNFDLTIENGEFIIFSGQSGCGKTTLLNMIGAIEPVDSGKIIVDGKNICDKKNKLNYFRTKAGFLFQNFALAENKTVAENLEMIKKKYSSGISMQEALKKVGLSDKLNQKIYKLSGGEQQRIALARLMMKKSDIILADEPTGSLDRKNAEIVMNILHDLNNSGKTIIMVTHDENIIKQGSRVICLQDYK